MFEVPLNNLQKKQFLKNKYGKAGKLCETSTETLHHVISDTIFKED